MNVIFIEGKENYAVWLRDPYIQGRPLRKLVELTQKCITSEGQGFGKRGLPNRKEGHAEFF